MHRFFSLADTTHHPGVPLGAQKTSTNPSPSLATTTFTSSIAANNTAASYHLVVHIFMLSNSMELSQIYIYIHIYCNCIIINQVLMQDNVTKV